MKMKCIKSENGAIMVEATIYMPLVLCTVMALLYLALFNMQEYLLMYQAQRVAAVVSREEAYLGYEEFGIGFEVYHPPQTHLYVLHVGLAAVKRTHEIEGWQKHRFHSLLFEIALHQRCRHEFALGKYLFLACLSERFGEIRAQEGEYACYGSRRTRFRLHGREQLFYDRHIFGVEAVDSFLSTGDIALVEIFCYLYKGIGCARHGREHYHIAAFFGYKFSHMAHAFGRAY